MKDVTIKVKLEGVHDDVCGMIPEAINKALDTLYQKIWQEGEMEAFDDSWTVDVTMKKSVIGVANTPQQGRLDI